MTPLALFTDPPGESPPTDAHLDWLRDNGRGGEADSLRGAWRRLRFDAELAAHWDRALADVARMLGGPPHLTGVAPESP